jgi:hypothetical protein
MTINFDREGTIVSTALVAVVSDAFGLFTWPGGALAGEVLSRLFKNRADAAQEIMLSELTRGNVRFSEIDPEECVAIVYRYLRAAHEGAARNNLRLLSQVLAGQARLGLVKADEFLYYADILTSMRRDEILLTGAILRSWNAASAQASDPTKRMQTATIQAKVALISDVFEDDADFRSVADGLRRTGFLLTQPTAGGGDLLGPSPLLIRLSKLTDFQTVEE